MRANFRGSRNRTIFVPVFLSLLALTAIGNFRKVQVWTDRVRNFPQAAMRQSPGVAGCVLHVVDDSRSELRLSASSRGVPECRVKDTSPECESPVVMSPGEWGFW